MEIKVLFTAMGSIGRRHLLNLKKITEEEQDQLVIDVLRKSKRQLPDDIKHLIHREIFDLNLCDEKYDIVFITSPTACHYEEILYFRERAASLFIEKPVFENARYDMAKIVPVKNQIFYVAAPMRYTDVLGYLKELVKKERFYSARIICSSYMPDWQKGRDYRKSFRTREALGGGVDIDLIHEIDYMVDLFGFPEAAARTAGKYSALEMDACDLAAYLFTYETLAAEVHLDYFGRLEQRKIELLGKDDVVTGDFLAKEVSFLRGQRTIRFDPAVDHYYREMKYFLHMVKAGDASINPNPVEKAWKVLKLAKGE